MTKAVVLGGFIAVGLACLAVTFNHVSQQRGLGRATLPRTNETLAQTKISRVPFVGCKSDGQSGPVEAPAGKYKDLDVASEANKQLAYYSSTNDSGVLAPLGWYCYGTYGSDGTHLFVSPKPIDIAKLDSETWRGFTGPIVALSSSNGGTSGRYQVASMIGRVFPKHKEFLMKVVDEGVEPATSFPIGPYPEDRLKYKSNETVEYETPANTTGLGNDSHILRNGQPIMGVVMIAGQETDLFRLSVRLPAEDAVLALSIIQQLEAEIARQPKAPLQQVASEDQAQDVSSKVGRSSAEMGYPVSEDIFVTAYMLANLSKEDYDKDQLEELAHDEYRLGKMMDTKSLLLTGSMFHSRGMRAMDYIEKYRREHP